MSNLQTAFNGESNAHARYLAFAVKADAEGYAGVASLSGPRRSPKRSTPVTTLP